MEWLLAHRGFRPTVVDSPELWSAQRDRASSLGSRAIILIGASRAQLDVDLATLEQDSGQIPVQLAIDGSSFLPVLADLAADDRVTGTILVDYQDSNVVWRDHEAAANQYIAFWSREQRRGRPVGFAASEFALSSLRQRFLRTYADGAGPMVALTHRILPPRATPQYLLTLPGRERAADYTRVPMPDFYYQRAMRNAGIAEIPPQPSLEAFEAALSDRIDALPQAPTAAFDDNAKAAGQFVDRIQARGGHVVFVMFPRSGLVKKADDVRFPRDRFWDRIVAETGEKGLNFSDVPALAAFYCPDGSHLDAKDRVAFTHAMAMSLLARGWIGPGIHLARNNP
jgi:hypothetical protein